MRRSWPKCRTGPLSSRHPSLACQRIVGLPIPHLGPLGPYQLQAAIAALHAQAADARETDWRQIEALYEQLLQLEPSAVVALNRAVAVAMSRGWEAGFRQIDELGDGGELQQYYLFHSARADILRRMGRAGEAVEAYRRALALATNRVERDFLQRRINAAI
jgi:RNA polymerase sigma-70 factor (ECF subfamily)